MWKNKIKEYIKNRKYKNMTYVHLLVQMKSDLCELWQQHTQLKTREMNEA